MPRHDYDTSSRQYRSNGNLIPRAEVRREIDKLIDFVSKDAARLAAQYEAGDIKIAEFETAMRELLKAGHIISWSVGRGGRQRMTQSDWSRVGSAIKNQYAYLDRFVRKLSSGTSTKAYSQHRARTYASSLYISFSRAEQEAKTEYVPGADNPEQIYATLVQNSKEGCEECSADADAGPQPIEDVAPIGERLCGDFCLCLLEFTDADGNEI